MKVFKFGGASVKDAEAIKNVASIIDLFPKENLLVVISAMGKTTNALEIVAQAIWKKDKSLFENTLNDLKDFHDNILSTLFSETPEGLKNSIENIYIELQKRFNQEHADNFNYEYDQIVSLGEVLSTLIVSHYLKTINKENNWLDARKIVRTDRTYREGNVNWIKTKENVDNLVLPLFENTDLIITQGFVGYTPEGFTTTLGREGSDYTAAIFAYCLDAEDVTIWKDVPGMLNADPKYFDNTIKLDQISFKEAIELSYYGASVIHPKTIKPLQNKNIGLFVKSFIDPHASGTVIHKATEHDSNVPSFIFKMNQLLVSITTKDFSFIVEEHLSDIFKKLSKLQVKMNVMQNSALSFRILVDSDKLDQQKFIELFEESYLLNFDDSLELVTIRHFDQATIDRVTVNKEVLLEQKTKDTARLILKEV